MLLVPLECRFNGPVPRSLALGAVVDQATLSRRQALARAGALSRMAARARADIAHWRRFDAGTLALLRGRERLEWARAEAERWRRRAVTSGADQEPPPYWTAAATRVYPERSDQDHHTAAPRSTGGQAKNRGAP